MRSRPLPAATVVLLRPGPRGLETLLTRRPATMAFGPDIHVFPGGRVDPADSAPGALAAAGLSAEQAAANLALEVAADGGLTPVDALAHHLAAVRETAEETGIRVRASDLISLTRWVTPISLSRRFDARFFAALVAPGTEVAEGSAEVAEAAWMTPVEALAAAAAGRIQLWQPTFVTLQQLVGLDDEARLRAAFAPGPGNGGPVLEKLGPTLTRVDGPWAGGIPGRRASGWLVGERELVIVDPADPTGVTTDAVLEAAVARSARLVGVAISGLDPQRHAGVEMFAHGLDLPVASPDGLPMTPPYPVQPLGLGDEPPFGDVDWRPLVVGGAGGHGVPAD